jgi:uncharacterized ParB-like nuclease family protein
MGEAGAGRGSWNADQMLAARALDLPAGVAGIALQGLIAVGAVEFEFTGCHRFHLCKRKEREKISKGISILFADKIRIIL